MDELDTAADAVAALDAALAVQGAADIADAFEVAGARIAQSLEQAARSGELSFEAMAESVLKDLARLAVGELIEAPLSALINGLTDRLGGASAKGATTINLNLNGGTDAAGFQRSEGQIVATLARAVSLGQQRT